jgi:hypothetical protein
MKGEPEHRADKTMTTFDDRSFRRDNPMLAKLAAAEAAWIAGGAGGASRPGADTAQKRERHIREAAYFRAQRRGFEPGHELEDWVAAEQELDRTSRSLPR